MQQVARNLPCKQTAEKAEWAVQIFELMETKPGKKRCSHKETVSKGSLVYKCLYSAVE